MKKFLRSGFLLGALFVCLGINAQTTISTIPPLSANNGSTAVTFEMTTTTAILVTGISNTFNTGSIGAEVWYRVGGVLPAGSTTPSVSVANGWVLAGSATITSASNTAPTAIPIANMSIPINPGTPVGFCVAGITGGTRYMTYDGTLANTHTAGGATVHTGPGFGFGGSFPAPTIATRSFVGSVTFSPAGPCVNPPIVGAATTNKAITCSGEMFLLSLASTTSGTGQTFQWQSSTDNLTWSNIVGATTLSYSTSQSSSNYYRCQVTCGTTVTSTSVLVTTTATALPAGTYTINGNLVTGGSNFNSFSDFKQAIVCGGIAGPVVVNVISKGSAYNEQVAFGAIGGVSATNTITINGNGQTISFGGGAQYATMLFNGSSHFKIKNLKIEGSGTASNFGVQLTGGSQYIEFDSCTVSINQASTSSTTAAFVVSGSLTSATTAGVTAQNITVTNSIIEGGYYCFTLLGPTAAPFSGNNVIENNTIRDFYLYGLYCANQDGAIIKSNDVNRMQRMGTITTFYGMYFFGNQTGSQIIGNKIHNPGDQNTAATFTAYSMYMSGANASAASPMIIANNAIYELNGSGLNYAIYLASGNFINLYHNTVSVDNYLASTSTSAQRALFLGASSGTFEIKNNVFQMSHVGTGAKHIIYLTSAVPTYSIDYNQYYMGSSAGTNTFGFYGGTAAATFSDWKLLNSGAFDANGNYGDAVFAADFHTPQSGVGNNNGTNLLSIVPADINGVARTATPDRGAVEFVPLACLQPFNYAGTSTSSVINLSWSNVPGADSVHIEYGPSGFTQGTGLTMFADSTLTVTGLFANTCYDFYFTSYCGGTAGNGTGLFTFCTTCNLATLPYTEPFTTWPPACFTITGDNSWLWDHNLANGYAQARFWNYSVGTSTMQTKRVDVNTAAWVKFKWAHLYSSSYPDDRLIVRAKATTATTWDTIADLKGPAFSSPNSANTTPPASASDFIEEQIILDPAKFLNKEVDFQLIALTDFGPNLYIDEFVVEAVPACLPPFSINATGVTATATSINWSSVAGTCFNLEYGPQGFIQGTGQGTLINNATSPQAITGLTPNTWYDVYIADCCNSGVWAGPFSWKTNCLSQMNGAYTVGGTGTNNFPTLAAAITTLTGCGVSGPVTINLINGAHALPSTTFASILGVSATNTVTINGMGVANDTISFGAGTAVGLTFNGAQHIKFQNLTINATSVDRPVWLTGGTHHITFNNCHILGNATSTSGLSCVIAATGSATSLSTTGNNADRITISNCKLSGGYYGFTAYGTGTTDYDKGFVLTDNEFVDQYYYGIRMYYTDSVVVERNIVTGFRNTFAYGYYGFYNSNIVMKQNQFFAPTYGLYISQLNTANATTNSEMSNNFMGGGTYGAYITTYSKLNVYHNSFGGGTSGYYSFTPNGDVNIRNNIFGGISSYAFYSSTAPATGFTLNYNIYHSISGASIAYCATAQSTLAAWKTAQPAFNVNSLQGDPGFVSNTDYHILGTFPNGVGQNGLSAIDIDGDTRPAAGSTTVDIGADEFTPLNWDASLEALLVPLGGCGSATTMVQAVIKNFGMNTITSLPLTVNYSGGLTGTMNVTASVNIPQGATDTVTIGTFNTFAGATGVNFMGYASLVGDQKNSNDTLAKGPANYIPVEPVTHGMVDTVCPVGTVDLYAIGVPGTEYKWYDAAVGGNVVGTGDSITVPANGITTYYVAYDSTSVTPQVGTGTLVSTSTYITPYKTFYMDGRAQYLVLASELQALGIAGGGQINSLSFEVASPSAQLMTDFTIKVGGTSVSSMTAAFQPNTTMTTVYNAAYTTVSGWNVHTFTSPYIWNGSDNLIFEICYDNTAWTTNSSVYYTTTPFPSATDGYADLSASSGCTPGQIANQVASNSRPNMQINLRTIACSTTRKPVSFAVDPNAAVATFSHVVQSNGADVNFDATGSVGQTYAWDFGDGNTGTGLTTTHTYAAGGTYTACLIVTDLTCNSVDSLCQTVLATVGQDESLLNQSLNVFPNPNNGKFRVEFQVEGLKNVTIRVNTLLGQEVYSSQPGNISGEYKEEIDLSNEATAVYVLQIITDDNVLSRRITIRK